MPRQYPRDELARTRLFSPQLVLSGSGVRDRSPTCCVLQHDDLDPLCSHSSFSPAVINHLLDRSTMAFTSEQMTVAHAMRTFVVPALTVFILPALTLFFFLHVRDSYDSDLRQVQLLQIHDDPRLDEATRLERFNQVEAHPVSELIEDPTARLDLPVEILMERETLEFRYRTFHWMIRLAAASLVAATIVVVVAGVCILLSLHSRGMQLVSLSVGWWTLRLYAAVQSIVHAVLILGLTYWIPAFWFEVIQLQAVAVAGILVLMVTGTSVLLLFRRPAQVFPPMDGTIIRREDSPDFWSRLDAICAKVGTRGPDHVIAGVAPRFFVTEYPHEHQGQRLEGRMLYVSLPLLKQFDGEEADAVIAHEMAHFSGEDTLYSARIAPLLIQYGQHLDKLNSNAVSKPVAWFLMSMRAFFELSLSRSSREREVRADRIATEVTSGRSLAGALVRLAMYLECRSVVEERLITTRDLNEKTSARVLVESRLATFAHEHAQSFDPLNRRAPHPFDTHPPLADRLAGSGLTLDGPSLIKLVAPKGDGRAYADIGRAEEREVASWAPIDTALLGERRFRLAHIFSPCNEEELAVVIEFFPGLRIDGKNESLVIDHRMLNASTWQSPIPFASIVSIEVERGQALLIRHVVEGSTRACKLLLTGFPDRGQQIPALVTSYLQRHRLAHAPQPVAPVRD